MTGVWEGGREEGGWEQADSDTASGAGIAPPRVPIREGRTRLGNRFTRPHPVHHLADKERLWFPDLRGDCQEPVEW